MSVRIHIPTKEEEEAALQEFFAQERVIIQERRKASQEALPALQRLAEVMRGRSGQPYKVRTILYSIWNGKPAAVVELVNLDWSIRKDLAAVLLAFGYEDDQVEFFYDAIEAAVKAAGQWQWFLEERFNVGVLEEYVNAAREEKEGA